MENKNRIKKEVVWFVAITLLFTYLIGIAGLLQGSPEHFPVSMFSMIIPAFVCVALYLIWKKPIFRGNDLGLRLPKWKYWFLAPASMFLLITAMYAISYVFNPEFILSKEIIFDNLSKASINSGGDPILNLGLILLLNIFIAPVLNFPIFLGEELGWRGYLTPRLLKIIGPAKAFILSGAIWGIWHLFGIIMGHNYPGAPLPGIFMMMLLCVPMGVIFQYYHLKSGSVFIPMMAHGAVNWTASIAMNFFVNHDNINTLYHGPTGIIGIAIFWIAGIFYYKWFIELFRSKEPVTS